jgi:hypothetical protein
LEGCQESEALLPSLFGGTWSAFVHDWCDGHVPGYPVSEAISALRTVGEQWPEAISGDRGMYSACALIELGKALNRTRMCLGFDALLARLKKLDQGAHAELIVASALIGQGLQVRLDVPYDGSVLDLAIESDTGPVYVEVTAPLESVHLAHQRTLCIEFGVRLDHANSGFSVEVEFMEDLTRELIDTVLERLSTDDSANWQTIASAARFRRWPAPVESQIRSIAYPGVDRRAEQIIKRKSGQLSASATNIIVIDVSSIGASVDEWLLATRRMLQPTKNRRIGAVALFQSFFSVHLDRGYRLWSVVENPNAFHPVPPAILRAFAALDEGEQIGRVQSSASASV